MAKSSKEIWTTIDIDCAAALMTYGLEFDGVDTDDFSTPAFRLIDSAGDAEGLSEMYWKDKLTPPAQAVSKNRDMLRRLLNDLK